LWGSKKICAEVFTAASAGVGRNSSTIAAHMFAASDDPALDACECRSCSFWNSTTGFDSAWLGSGHSYRRGNSMTRLVAACAAELRGRAARIVADFEGILITEIAAGNIVAATPMAACGRVALSMACAAARSYVKPLRA
jgi:hypothetical protein